MPHRKSQRKTRIGMKIGPRKQLVKNLATQLVLYEKVKTTAARARLVRPVVERLITVAKTKEPLTAIRALNQKLTMPLAAKKIMTELKDGYADRTGGYVRVVSLGYRKGDGAAMVMMELIPSTVKKAPAEKEGGEQKSAPTKSAKVTVKRRKAAAK